MTPADALRTIASLEKFGIDLGVERITACLDALGRPQLAYATIHVGGTNGKGSTCLLTAEVLRQSGLRVGLYTSPPLETFGERMRVDGEPLPDAALPELLERVLEVRDRLPALAGMTQFEVITAMAFLHFQREGIDAAVIEVGLGGRLDSTNVLRPIATAVTNVGLEHAEHLGPTVADIAREKAGIAKPGVPLVTAAEGDALSALEAEAGRIGAPVLALGRDFRVQACADGGWSFSGTAWNLGGLKLGLSGAHQGLNLAVSLALLELAQRSGMRVGEQAVRAGLAGARWPGRLELVQAGDRRVLLDGAHNPHASRVLRAALQSGFPRGGLFLVLGILGDKDARSILGDLLPLADRVIFTRSASARALPPRELESLVGDASQAPVEVVPEVGAALEAALSSAGAEDLVCVTGSLTTVGEARGWLRSKGWVR